MNKNQCLVRFPIFASIFVVCFMPWVSEVPWKPPNLHPPAQPTQFLSLRGWNFSLMDRHSEGTGTWKLVSIFNRIIKLCRSLPAIFGGKQGGGWAQFRVLSLGRLRKYLKIRSAILFFGENDNGQCWKKCHDQKSSSYKFVALFVIYYSQLQPPCIHVINF
jgi:hypothetical protein